MDFELSKFCTDTADILQFVGWVVTIIKVAIPILIVFFGILDFGKAVTGGDTKNIQESFKKFGIRVLAGLIIFFIPSIVVWLFTLITAFNDSKEGWDNCRYCILQPWSKSCDTSSANKRDK